MTDNEEEAVAFMMAFDTLRDMGYQKDQIDEALLLSKNDTTKALDYLTSTKRR